MSSSPTYVCQPLLQRLDSLVAETTDSHHLARLNHLKKLAQRSGTVRYHSLKSVAYSLKAPGLIIEPVVFYSDSDGTSELSLVEFGQELAGCRSVQPDAPLVSPSTMQHYQRGALMPSSAILESLAAQCSLGWAYFVPREVKLTETAVPQQQPVNLQLLFGLVERCFRPLM